MMMKNVASYNNSALFVKFNEGFDVQIVPFYVIKSRICDCKWFINFFWPKTPKQIQQKQIYRFDNFSTNKKNEMLSSRVSITRPGTFLLTVDTFLSTYHTIHLHTFVLCLKAAKLHILPHYGEVY